MRLFRSALDARLRRSVPIVAILLSVAQSASAAQAPSAPPVIIHERSWTVWGAAAWHAPLATRAGPSTRDFQELGIRLAYGLISRSGARIAYVTDVVPLARSTNTPVAFVERQCFETSLALCEIPVTRTTYGVGLSPLGLDLAFERIGAVALHATVTGGLLWFEDRIPDPEAAKLNFTTAGSVSAVWPLGLRSHLELGVLEHHTSNAGTRPANPNARMLIAGFGLTR